MNLSKKSSPNWEPPSSGSNRKILSARSWRLTRLGGEFRKKILPALPLTLTRPMAGLALAQGAGIAAALSFPADLLRLTIPLACMACYILYHFRAHFSVSLIPLFFAAGWLSLLPWLTKDFPQNHVSRYLDTGRVKATGVVSGRPYQYSDRTRLNLDLESLETQQGLRDVQGKIRVTIRPPVHGLRAGARIQVTGEIRSLRNFANPGGFDYVRYMRFQDLFGSSYVRGSNNVEVLDPGGSVLDAPRAGLKTLIDENASEKVRPLLRALLLGEKEGISQDLRDVFSSAGIAHILAISGLHIGMVALFAFKLFRLLFSRFPRILLWGRLFSICAAFTIGPILYYGFLTGMSPSTQRAVIMVGVFLLAYVFDRDYDSLNTLGLAGLIILAMHPPSLFDVGFQLSFAAVFCILFGLKSISFKTVPITWQEKLKREFLVYLLIPILAAVGTVPLCLYYFDRFSIIGPVANLVVVPLVGFLVLPLCLMASALLPLLPGVSGVMILCAGYVLEMVMWLADFLAALPFASIMPVKPNFFEVILYYAILATLLQIRKKWAKHALVACLVCILADAGYWAHKRFGNEDLRVTFLDVGQGGSALVEFPHGPVMLVDGGGLSATSRFDTGRMIVAPYLWQRKIHTIDYLVLTHPQHDHAGGLGYIAERFRIGEFWSNGQPASIDAYERLIEACAYKKIPMPGLGDLFGEQNIAGVSARVLHPAPGFSSGYDSSQALNENSLVLRLSLGSQSVLFTGDIEEEGESLLVGRWGEQDLASTLCAAPHHGSRTSSSAAFVSAIRPSHIVFSTGARNWYGFPDENVVKRYKDVGARIFNTGKQGACVFSTRGDEWSVETFLDGEQGLQKN